MKTLLITIAALIVGALVGVYALAPVWQPAPEVASGDAAAPAAPAADAAGAPVRWKMAGAFPSTLVQLGTLGTRYETLVDKVSGGNIKIKYFEPGALVPTLEIFDAVSSGSVDAGWSGSGFWAGKVPALQFFTTVPFGPEQGEYLAWMEFGGGRQLFEELYAPHNIHPIHCGTIAPEGSGWFREEIKTLDDLRGLKMRFFGRGGKVIATLGAGDFVGELSMLAGIPRTATVTADSDLTVEALNRREFASLLDESPRLARKVLIGAIRRLHAVDHSPAD